MCRPVLLQSLAIDSDFFIPMLKFVRWFGIKPDFSRAIVNDTLPIKVCKMLTKMENNTHYNVH